MHLGIRESHTPTQSKTRWPQINRIRTFAGGIQRGELVAPVRNYCTPVWDSGLTPVISFKTDPAATAQGKMDAPLHRLGAYLRTQPAVEVIWYHEPEDNFSGATFRPAFTRVRDILRQYGIPVGYACNSYRWRYGAETKRPADWAVAADFYAADVYSGSSFPLDTLERHAGFQRWLTEYLPVVGATNYWVTERGFPTTDSAGRAQAIFEEATWLTDSTTGRRCEGYLFWNTPGAENDPTLVLDNAGSVALRDLFARVAMWGA